VQSSLDEVSAYGAERPLLDNLEKAKQQVLVAVKADPEMLLEACIFEIVTTQVEQVAVPGWAFSALGRPVEKGISAMPTCFIPTAGVLTSGDRVRRYRT
jgi:hypothetical protein